MSRLRDLARARGDDVAVLAWVTKHAPDGDEAAQLARAWADETAPAVLIEVLRQLERPVATGALPAWRVRIHARNAQCPTYQGATNTESEGCALDCVACCNAIRSVDPAPTWAELTGEPEP